MVRAGLAGGVFVGSVDPRDLGDRGQRGRAGEPSRVGRTERLDRFGSLVLDRRRGADVGGERRVKPDPRMVMPVMVVIEEMMAPGSTSMFRTAPRCRGLSLLTFGREWDLMMSRSSSSTLTGLEVIEVPLSEWMVPGRRRASHTGHRTAVDRVRAVS